MKNHLRQSIKEKLQRIDGKELIRKNAIIEQKFYSLNLVKSAKAILFFVSHGHEPFTHSMIQKSLSKGIKVYVPKVVDGFIRVIRIKKWEDLERGHGGILEPLNNKFLLRQPRLDLILVPGLVFDLRGHRIGRGKGHYDAFLKLQKAYKLGLCFQEQLVEKCPEENHDVPVDSVLTD